MEEAAGVEEDDGEDDGDEERDVEDGHVRLHDGRISVTDRVLRGRQHKLP